MLKKTMTFNDLDGKPVTEDFYFNLSKAELAEMQLVHEGEGGFTAYLQKIMQDKDGSAIVETFKQILSMSVGKRSEDGRRFIKSKEITEDFMQTEAYSNLFVELVTNAAKSVEFIKGLVPADLASAIDSGKAVVELPQAETPDLTPNSIEKLRAEQFPKRLQDYTREELLSMTPEEYTALRNSF